MPVTDGFISFLKEHLRDFGPVSFRKMFGGGGIYREGLMFGLIADDVVFFKADEQTIPDFEAEGLGPFIFEMKNGKKSSMSYYRVPERLMDDAHEMAEWAANAFDVAVRADNARSPTKRKRKI